MQAQSITTDEPTEAPQDALDAAERAARRARRSAQLRKSFIAREGPDDPAPPMARILRGGRGGDVRLRLLLSFLWFQTDGSQAVPLAYPAQMWARLLGLNQPETAGARRINDAIGWLEKNNFIRVEAKPGSASTVTVLSESGDGTAYTPPGYAANRLRNKPEGLKHLYVQIPEQLWTNGYLAMLKGAGLAFYLMLLDQYTFGYAADNDFLADRAVWFSPKTVKDRYDISDDTRAKGMKELNALRVIAIKRQPINPHDFDLERIRNTYILNADTIIEEPARKRPAPKSD